MLYLCKETNGTGTYTSEFWNVPHSRSWALPQVFVECNPRIPLLHTSHTTEWKSVNKGIEMSMQHDMFSYSKNSRLNMNNAIAVPKRKIKSFSEVLFKSRKSHCFT